MPEYDLKSLSLPVLSGVTLKLYASALNNRLLRSALITNMFQQGGIENLLKMKLSEPPTFLPLVVNHHSHKTQETESPDWESFTNSAPQSLPYRTASSYHKGYLDGSLDPIKIAEGVLQAIQASDEIQPPLRAFIASDHDDVLGQAQASKERYRQGKPLSLLDGVPLAIKDEIDLKPYPTKVGTTFLGRHPAGEDSRVAARLRAAGALLVGKTNMHEIGINPNSSNAHYGPVRNPFNPTHDSGGSSSGSAAAVAAGLVPLAIGADGGGSIRIPAALCGVVGLKATFGRISEFGAAPLCWSVGHLGPIGTCVADVAAAYAIIAGTDPYDPNTLSQPAMRVRDWNKPDLSGLRLGIYSPWFNHADPEVVAACNEMLTHLKEAGAQVTEITIPELDEMRVAHVIAILGEMAAEMRNHQPYVKQMGASVRIGLGLGNAFSAGDYVQAQRMRTRAINFFKEIFEKVDVIISPATAIPAPLIPSQGVKNGWSDLSKDTEVMRYVFAANLTGLPAISFPAGYTRLGLPIGMQAMGRWWEEHILLRTAYTAEQFLQRKRPFIFYNI